MSDGAAQTAGAVEAIPSSRAECEHCGSKGADFTYEAHNLCCECMSSFTSWILDGGIMFAPDAFAYMLTGSQSGRGQ